MPRSFNDPFVFLYQPHFSTSFFGFSNHSNVESFQFRISDSVLETFPHTNGRESAGWRGELGVLARALVPTPGLRARAPVQQHVPVGPSQGAKRALFRIGVPVNTIARGRKAEVVSATFRTKFLKIDRHCERVIGAGCSHLDSSRPATTGVCELSHFQTPLFSSRRRDKRMIFFSPIFATY